MRPALPPCGTRARAWFSGLFALLLLVNVASATPFPAQSDRHVAPATADGQIPLLIQASDAIGLSARVEELGGRIEHVFENIDALAVTIPPDALALLAADSRVQSVQRQRLVTVATVPVEIPQARAGMLRPRTEGDLVPLLTPGTTRSVPLSELQSAQRGDGPGSFMGYDEITGAAESWEAAGFGEGVVVAVIDTGVYPQHPMFAGNVVGGLNFVPAEEEHAIDHNFDGQPDGLDFDWDALENHGHGTFVSGIIAGHVDLTLPADDALIASIAHHRPQTVSFDGDFATLHLRGAAPAASIFGVKVFPYNGAGAPDARVAAAIDRLISMKIRGELDVDVINMSLSGPVLFDGWNALDRTVNAATYHGITVVSSASNDGPSLTSVGSPASAFTGLAVGGTLDPLHTRIAIEMFTETPPGTGTLIYPHEVLPVDFASRGLTADRRVKPDITATAFLLFSSTMVDFDQNGLNDTAFFGFGSGTSFSAPTVSGCAALVTAFAERNGRFDRAPFIANALRRAAYPIAEFDRVSMRDQGRGFVDVAEAIRLVERGNVWSPGHVSKRHRLMEKLNLRHGADGDTPDLNPGESFDYLIDVPEGVSNIHFEFPNVSLGQNQNPLFGDGVGVYIHSAKRGGSGDYVFGEGLEPGMSFDYVWPEPGTMRVTFTAQPFNYDVVSAGFIATANRQTIPIDERFRGTLRRDEVAIHEVEVPEGLSALAIRLDWKHDWTRYPTYDLDMFVESPDGFFPVASLDAPELAWIENPTAGKWTFAIADIGTILHRERYGLELAFMKRDLVHDTMPSGDLPRPRVAGITPNPASSTTEITLSVPADEPEVNVEVFDVAGRRVRTLVNAPLDAGQHRIRWDGRNDRGERASAGVYFVKMETGKTSSSRKVILVK